MKSLFQSLSRAGTHTTSTSRSAADTAPDANGSDRLSQQGEGSQDDEKQLEGTMVGSLTGVLEKVRVSSLCVCLSSLCACMCV